MLTLISALWALHLPVSILRFQKKAELVLQLHNPSFSASCDWVNKGFTRHNLALRACISINQKLLHLFSLVVNMTETPTFFEMISSKYIANKGDNVWFVFQGVKR